MVLEPMYGYSALIFSPLRVCHVHTYRTACAHGSVKLYFARAHDFSLLFLDLISESIGISKSMETSETGQIGVNACERKKWCEPGRCQTVQI